MIRAVLFDMDGVLTDTERIGGEMIHQALAMQGLTMHDERWKSLIGTSLEHTNRVLAQWYPSIDSRKFSIDWRDVTFAYVHTHGVPLKKGAATVLPTLKAQGYLLGLCTNNASRVVREYLRLLHWEDAFDVIVTASDIADRKPSPETYLHASRLLHLDARACAGVEDSPSGLTSVHSAGMTSICIPDLIDLSCTDPETIDYTLQDLDQLPDLLARLNPEGET